MHCPHIQQKRFERSTASGEMGQGALGISLTPDMPVHSVKRTQRKLKRLENLDGWQQMGYLFILNAFCWDSHMRCLSYFQRTLKGNSCHEVSFQNSLVQYKQYCGGQTAQISDHHNQGCPNCSSFYPVASS